MTGMLLSKGFVAQFGGQLQAAAKAAGIRTSSGADLCEGCGRTFDELCRWFDMTPEQRLAVWQRIEAADTIRNLRRRQATGR